MEIYYKGPKTSGNLVDSRQKRGVSTLLDLPDKKNYLVVSGRLGYLSGNFILKLKFQYNATYIQIYHTNKRCYSRLENL